MSIFNARKNISSVSKDTKNGVTMEVFEYNELTASSLDQAASLYFAQKSGIKLRQVVVSLSGQEGVTLSPGAMSFTLGNISMTSNVKGVGDLIGKAFSAKVTGEQVIKPLYKGTGDIALEPSYRHYLVKELNNETFVLDDGIFFAASEGINISTKMNTQLSSAALGNEGLFNLTAKGTGLLLLESKLPMDEIVVVNLDDSSLRVDGNFALMWSGGLQFTVEKSGKSLLGSAVSGEGFVNVYKGTGIVWLAPSAKMIV